MKLTDLKQLAQAALKYWDDDAPRELRVTNDYIAAMSPDQCLALIERVEKAEQIATSAANGLDEMIKAIKTKSVDIASPTIIGQGDPEHGYETWHTASPC